MPREYGTDPSGILSRGAPGAGSSNSGASVSIGRVGTPMGTMFPGVRAGTGTGAKVTIPVGSSSAVKKKAAGGVVTKMAKGGKVRGDGCASKGKTRGRFV